MRIIITITIIIIIVIIVIIIRFLLRVRLILMECCVTLHPCEYVSLVAALLYTAGAVSNEEAPRPLRRHEPTWNKV